MEPMHEIVIEDPAGEEEYTFRVYDGMTMRPPTTG